jgi:geranylgeranyl transferase type-2 subunit beta
MTSHLRMNAVYWGLTALCIMKHKEALDAEEMIEYVMTCWDDEAGALHHHLYQITPPLCSVPR